MSNFENSLHSRLVPSVIFHPYSFSIIVKAEIQVRFPKSIFFKSSRWPKLNRKGLFKKKKNQLHFKVEKIVCSAHPKSVLNAYDWVKFGEKVNFEV